MKILVVEDDVYRLDWFRDKFKNQELSTVMTADEAITLLSKSLDYEIIFLDHDLGGRVFVNSSEHNTGFTVAMYLKNKDYKNRIIVHSLNPVGAKNIKNILPQAELVPYPVLINVLKVT